MLLSELDIQNVASNISGSLDNDDETDPTIWLEKSMFSYYPDIDVTTNVRLFVRLS